MCGRQGDLRRGEERRGEEPLLCLLFQPSPSPPSEKYSHIELITSHLSTLPAAAEVYLI